MIINPVAEANTNEIIARFLGHEVPLPYTEQLELAWQALRALQELGYGYTIASVGRSMVRVRVVKWAGGHHTTTHTGEYIVDLVTGPVPLAICRAITETLRNDKIL